ncbi:DUF3021 family protein [Butyrivibrio sp. INlla14]|uniref:DUF3021 family protein n=1 Tax=Butyrivibrio sp. INlla14 TaxID=1520808 RepID=UPI000876771A|nr:DUF3021 family protein [Butyrivibrio sp. INlla14]SCX88900.1 Protein of unknown function [Butyrivibrio sp. INlla14]
MKDGKRKNGSRVTLWELYLTKEIGIEFKACLYFFAFLFYYCVFRMIGGIFVADILHMTELIFTCYFIGYLQVYVLWNFDEAEHLGKKEWGAIILCTALYCGVSYLFKWFDRNLLATILFAAYILIVYVCVFLIYKSKRQIDDKRLNEDLRIFQSEHKK